MSPKWPRHRVSWQRDRFKRECVPALRRSCIIMMSSSTSFGLAEDLDLDTKPCPFCGEEIKSVAIRCKHCQADLSKTPDADFNRGVSPEKAKESPADFEQRFLEFASESCEFCLVASGGTDAAPRLWTVEGFSHCRLATPHSKPLVTRTGAPSHCLIPGANER